MTDEGNGELKTAHRKLSLREWFRKRYGYYFKVKTWYRWRIVDEAGAQISSSPKSADPKDLSIYDGLRHNENLYMVTKETRRVMWKKTLKESLDRKQLNIWMFQEIHAEPVWGGRR